MALSTTVTSSVTSSPTAAAPIPGFTTPFPQPASCSLSSFLTTVVRTYSDRSGTEFRTALFPDQSDARYTACLDPAGGQLTFSPAVCPQGWPAMWLGMTTLTLSGLGSATTTTAFVSTAYCCAPGYSLPMPVGLGTASPSCVQTFIRTSSSSGAMVPARETLSVAYAPAWLIELQTTDVPTLSPRPPAIEGDRITQWILRSEPQREKVERWGEGINGSLFLFLVAGIPIIIVVAIGACVTWCCIVRFRRRRRNGGEAGNLPKGLGAAHTAS